MRPSDVLTRASQLPDAVLRYGNHRDAVIDVYLPPEDVGGDRAGGPRQLVVFLHGGFWRVEYDRVHSRPLTRALADEGFVVATPEYRRVGGEGPLAGGYPTTFEDVTAAVESLPGLLDELGVTTTRTTVVGHSAGGHLALWLANEDHSIDRVVGLAPVGDLRAAAKASTGGDAVPDFLGGSPAQIPQVYDAADPATRFATRPRSDVVILHGKDDPVVPIENSLGLEAAYPFVVMGALDDIEHFGVIDPLSPAWPYVRAAVAAEQIDLG